MVGVGGVSLVVNVDMSWTIYYSHYMIVMTQMMVGNYRAQMPLSPISLCSGHHHQRRPGERREPTRWDIKYRDSKTQTPPARLDRLLLGTKALLSSPQLSLPYS